MAWDASKTGWIRQKTGLTPYDRPPGSFGPGANTASVTGAPTGGGSIWPGDNVRPTFADTGGSASPGASSIMEWIQRLREMGRSGMMGQSQQGASGGASSIIEWLQRLQGRAGTARTGGIIGQDIPDTRPVWAGEGGPHIVPGPNGERPGGEGQAGGRNQPYDRPPRPWENQSQPELDGGYAGAPMPAGMRDAWANLIRIRR